MRERTRWRRGMMGAISQVWRPADGEIDTGRLLDVELALWLLAELCPEESAAAGSALMSGYPLLEAGGQVLSADDRRRLVVARFLLAPLRTRRDWSTAIDLYREAPENIRGFTLNERDVPVRRAPSVAANRFQVFAEALSSPPPLAKFTLPTATPGGYKVTVAGRMTSLTVPAELPAAEPPQAHQVIARQDRGPVTFTWSELRETAAWMDTRPVPAGQRAGRWQERFEGLRLAVRDQAGIGFVDTTQLTVDGMFHLIGMVSAGKSTLMMLLAVCAARRGLRVTIVVGDVIAAARHTVELRQLGISAAPMIGASSQRRHIDRLLRVHATKQRTGSMLRDFEPANDLLSTACALDALRPNAQPWDFRDAPCRQLLKPDENNPSKDKDHGCPLWGSCRRHQASRDLVDAAVWIATPASLLSTRVPFELNAESLRYLELAWRRSDLIIVDEADQVQAHLDAAFSPGQTLAGTGDDPWLQMLADHTDAELRARGWAQFSDRRAREWASMVDAARSANHRLYALLQREPLPRGSSTMRKWIGRDCFTEWTLADKLVRSWLTEAGEDVDKSGDPRYQLLRNGFDAFLLDPLGARGRAAGDELAEQLVALARELGDLSDELRRTDIVTAWLTDIRAKYDLPIDEGDLSRDALRLEFTLLVAVLSNSLNALIRGWRAVEAALNLDALNAMVFQRPPDDYSPVVPAPPMGAILGFQYRDEPNEHGAMGQLRFFRCLGVGRWVLLNLHNLFWPDADRGPAVLLMSGTSWAGSSPRFDIQHPVGGILRAPSSEIAAIRNSQFFINPVNDNGTPITVSGLRGSARRNALRTMVTALARRPRADRPSDWESERSMLPESRRRILVVVGSYDEAEYVAREIVECRPDWTGKVLHLVSDEAEFSTHWRPSLRRGEVTRLASTPAWILVAPLLAIERGHNILNEDGQAALGSAYFLVRPHPRPDDITYPVQAMNRWAVAKIREMSRGNHQYSASDLTTLERAFRSDGYRRWQHHLTVPLIYAALTDTPRDALAWTQLVTIWQVIGRLVRGGAPARVHFCDAKFAPNAARRGKQLDDSSTSLLVGMHRVLDHYLAPHAPVDPTDRELVDALYGPLHAALARVPGVTDAGV